MKPQVSVIIPSCNRLELLPRALRSVMAQKDVTFEVLVIDDGSTDGTAAMVARDFPEASLFSQTNQGPSAARNRGLERARGEWIAFLDSDDEWLPGKLVAQLGFFTSQKECRVMQTGELWIRNGRLVNPMKKHQKVGGWIFEQCLPLCIVSPSAVMMHRSVFEDHGTFDEQLPACEDYDLWLRIAAREPIGYLETPFVKKYGGHPDQTSHKYPAMDRFRIRALSKLLASGTLNETQTAQARAMLEFKTRIYVAGAQKRGKHEEAEHVLNSLPFTAPA